VIDCNEGKTENRHEFTNMGKFNDSKYDGKRMSRDCLCGTYEIAGRLIFVEHSVETKCFVSEFSTYSLSLPSMGWIMTKTK